MAKTCFATRETDKTRTINPTERMGFSKKDCMFTPIIVRDITINNFPGIKARR
jgi:hypothetical protein